MQCLSRSCSSVSDHSEEDHGREFICMYGCMFIATALNLTTMLKIAILVSLPLISATCATLPLLRRSKTKLERSSN